MAGSGPTGERRKWAGAIAALLTEPTVRKAAERVGTSERQLHRWLRKPSFLRQFRAAKRSVVEAVVGRLQQHMTGAADTLVRLTTCGNPSVECRAASTILEMGLKGIEHGDVMDRLAELEQLVEKLIGEQREKQNPKPDGQGQEG
jgi:hypothetical protein